MSNAYKFNNPEGIYFTTTTVVQWIDVFTRQEYAELIIESLKFCQKEKGLVIHAWCLMSNHLHMIISKNGNIRLDEIIRDFKKYTSRRIISLIETLPESRKNWMLWIFKRAGEINPNNKIYQFWQNDNHPEELITNNFIDQKLDYIHNNPVNAKIVTEAQFYYYSSAIDYSGGKGLLEISFLD